MVPKRRTGSKQGQRGNWEEEKGGTDQVHSCTSSEISPIFSLPSTPPSKQKAEAKLADLAAHLAEMGTDDGEDELELDLLQSGKLEQVSLCDGKASTKGSNGESTDEETDEEADEEKDEEKDEEDSEDSEGEGEPESGEEVRKKKRETKKKAKMMQIQMKNWMWRWWTRAHQVRLMMWIHPLLSLMMGLMKRATETQRQKVEWRRMRMMRRRSQRRRKQTQIHPMLPTNMRWWLWRRVPLPRQWFFATALW